jgi:hypothetical protein
MDEVRSPESVRASNAAKNGPPSPGGVNIEAIDFSDRRYIVRFTNEDGAALYDTVTQSFPRDAEGNRIRVDRNTGKPLGQIERCAHCGAVKKKMLP